MQDERGDSASSEAGPSTPVQVIGLSGVPDAGRRRCTRSRTSASRSRSSSTAIDEQRERADGGRARGSRSRSSSAQADGRRPEGAARRAQGRRAGLGRGAARGARSSSPTDKVKVERDPRRRSARSPRATCMLAKASGAIVVGFHVRPDAAGAAARPRSRASTCASTRSSTRSSTRCARRWRACCRRRVKEVVPRPRRGAQDLQRAAHRHGRRLLRHRGHDAPRGASRACVRDGVQVYEGRFASLKRFKDDVREVQPGFECGIGLEGFNDVKVGDVIEAYVLEETPADALNDRRGRAWSSSTSTAPTRSRRSAAWCARSSQRVRNGFNVVGRRGRRAGHLAARRARARGRGQRRRSVRAMLERASTSSRSCTWPRCATSRSQCSVDAARPRRASDDADATTRTTTEPTTGDRSEPADRARRASRCARSSRACCARRSTDPRVGLVTLTRVDVSPDSRQRARVLERARDDGRPGRARGARTQAGLEQRGAVPAPPARARSCRCGACPSCTSATIPRSRSAARRSRCCARSRDDDARTRRDEQAQARRAARAERASWSSTSRRAGRRTTSSTPRARWFGTRRVGHLGTLDPLATGVLPLAVRDATKLVPVRAGPTEGLRGLDPARRRDRHLDAEGTRAAPRTRAAARRGRACAPRSRASSARSSRCRRCTAR